MNILSKCFFVLCIIFCCLSCKAQSETIKTKLEKADSIVIVSHIAIPELIKKDEKPEERHLVLNNKLNEKLILNRLPIKGTDKKTLISILSQPFQDTLIEEGKCFIPRNAILIYKNHKISYIEICFTCKEIEISTDIIMENKDFDNLTWKKLEEFFIKLSLK